MAGIESVRISVEAGAEARLRPIAEASGLPVRFAEAADNIADSVYRRGRGRSRAGRRHHRRQCAARAAPIEAVARRLSDGDDVVVALARKEDILAAHPDAQRNFYKFRDGGFSNCNLYGAVAGAGCARRRRSAAAAISSGTRCGSPKRSAS